MRRTFINQARDARGFTLIELLIVVVILGIVAALAIPGLLRARQAGSEASAVGSLRAINSAQFVFATTCGAGYFAPSLPVLGVGGAGAPYLAEDLTSAITVVKSQYTFTMDSTAGPAANAPATCNGQAAGTMAGSYWATATPTIGAGSRAFGTNSAGVIYQAVQIVQLAMTDTTAPAGATPVQ